MYKFLFYLNFRYLFHYILLITHLNERGKSIQDNRNSSEYLRRTW